MQEQTTDVHLQTILPVTHLKTETIKQRKAALKQKLIAMNLITENNDTLDYKNKRYTCDYDIQSIMKYYDDTIKVFTADVKKCHEEHGSLSKDAQNNSNGPNKDPIVENMNSDHVEIFESENQIPSENGKVDESKLDHQAKEEVHEATNTKEELREDLAVEFKGSDVQQAEVRNNVLQGHAEELKRKDDEISLLVQEMDGLKARIREIEGMENFSTLEKLSTHYITETRERSKMADDIEKLKLNNLILRKSLHFSYYKYASKVSDEVLGLLTDCIYESHAQRSDGSICNYPISGLQDDSRQKDGTACIKHFVDCRLTFENSSREFAQLALLKEKLTELPQPIGGMNEIVIKREQWSSVYAGAAVDKAVRLLKERFSEETSSSLLPSDVIILAHHMDSRVLANFECYRLASEEYTID